MEGKYAEGFEYDDHVAQANESRVVLHLFNVSSL